MFHERAEQNPKFMYTVEKAQNRGGQSVQPFQEPSREHTNCTEEPADVPALFAADIMGGAMYSTDISDCTDYVLHGSFIFDCGATTHVCNNC